MPWINETQSSLVTPHRLLKVPHWSFISGASVCWAAIFHGLKTDDPSRVTQLKAPFNSSANISAWKRKVEVKTTGRYSQQLSWSHAGLDKEPRPAPSPLGII